MSTSRNATSKAPWQRADPKAGRRRSRPLTAAAKASAKKAARRAGRPYPNLVDNMRAATASRSDVNAATTAGRGRKSAKSTSGRGEATRKRPASAKAAASTRAGPAARRAKPSARAKPRPKPASAPSTRKATTRDPRGGLTAAGRAEFLRKDGSHLKPGVRKPASEMTPQEMRRKGSWAVRFYGRADLPALTDAKGRPTRFALSAHAWGEPVPRTETQARKIAAKGRRLLERSKRAAARRERQR